MITEKQANLDQMRSSENQVEELKVRDLSQHLHLINSQGTAFHSVLTTRCLKPLSANNMKVEWIEDIEQGREFKVNTQSGNIITLVDGRDQLLRNDMLWDRETDYYYLVVSDSTDDLKLARLGFEGDLLEDDTYRKEDAILLVSESLIGKTLFKYSTAHPEGAIGGEGTVGNPYTCYNYLQTFRDFVEITDQTEAEDWLVDGYSYESYAVARAMRKHVQDINNNLYQSKKFKTKGRMMSKGLFDYPILKKTMPKSEYNIDRHDEFLFTDVKRCPNTSSDLVVLVNKPYLIVQRNLVKATTSMTFNPLERNSNKYGFKVSNLEHDSGNYEIVEDHTLTSLYPSQAVAVYIDPKRARKRHLKGKDTQLIKNVANANKDKDEINAHKIRTIGGSLQLINAENCHTAIFLT